MYFLHMSKSLQFLFPVTALLTVGEIIGLAVGIVIAIILIIVIITLLLCAYMKEGELIMHYNENLSI